MASLKLDHIYKVYPNGTKAVNDFTMDIKDGEFIVFVGPSGCGKSTTLRMIAGLEEISAGELYIGDTLVNDMEPKDRDVAMVFQNYALYPHMTVYENMAFGLTLRHLPRNVIHEKVMWAAEILGLKEYLDRKPRAMSGGQRQRVSLGRAILREPKVMLLDEPLSNLDAKLRSQMRSEISKLHQNLKTTFIYVTHDQVEAMTLGTRVVVMKLGRIQQVDTPKNLYDHPVNLFVAGFIGTPQMNFFNVTLRKENEKVCIKFSDSEQKELIASASNVVKAKKAYFDGEKPVTLGIRCEHLSVEEEDIAKGDNIIEATVSHFEELGNETLIYADLNEESKMFGTSKTTIIIKATSNHGFKPGERIKVRVDIEKAHFFDSKTERTILPAIPGENIAPVEIKDGKLNLLGVNKELPDAIKVNGDIKGSISIPIEAMKLINDGAYSGKVVKVEDINEKKLVYIQTGNEMFFALGDENIKEGQNIKFDFEYQDISVFDENGNQVVNPLVEKDDLFSSFVNFKTAYSRTQSEEFLNIKNSRSEQVEQEYAQKEAELKAKFDEEVAKIDTSNLEAKRSENAAKAKEIEGKIKAELAQDKAQYTKDLNEAKKKHNDKVKEIKEKVKQEYADMLAKEKSDYLESLKVNKDPDSRRARKALYESFKETLPAAKNNDLNNRINSESFEYDSEKSGIVARYTRNKFDKKSQLEETKKALYQEAYPVEVLTKKYEADLAALRKEKENALLHASLLFFFKYDDNYQIIPDDITNKIIQGLGSKVFTKTFKVRVPHDAYIENEKGIAARIDALVDYSSRKFYECKVKLYDEELTIYVEGEGKNVGDTILVSPDLSRTEIYETALNIRLY